MAITHHLTILATRANFERLSPKEFLHLDKHEKPLNCGVTRYIGNPNLGSRGKLELCQYNRQYDQTARTVSTGAGRESNRKPRARRSLNLRRFPQNSVTRIPG